ncbi:DUF2971 domain-containing protein [Bacteroides ovatus]|uniref:DUF2971 domain-containing protein n=1 Tax=Bacteroides ovatus TaxID=28116 RepID=A0A1G8QV81_BACOV|nr:DUF2971 domain-containing protein [Bacteroides ovatus]SDJ08080.1 Protein of unknown function [Bacteroides ovatus]
MNKENYYKYIDSLSFTNKLNKDLYSQHVSNINFPVSLVRFYPPLKRNIDDLYNKKLWLSDPRLFNDPFDCKVAFNDEDFIRHTVMKCMLTDIKKKGNIRKHFTKEDLSSIYKSLDTRVVDHIGYSIYKHGSVYDNLYKILSKKDPLFSKKINNILLRYKKRVFKHLKQTQNNADRIASFCNIGYNVDNPELNLMWAHYAQNYEGFCVEFNVNKIKEAAKVKGINSLEANIVGRLFPVYYCKHRVHIPTIIAEHIAINKISAGDSEIIKNKINRAYITKSTVWKYEHEWRLILDERFYETNPQNDKYKIDFPYVSSIFYGHNAKKSTIKHLKQLGFKLGVPVKEIQIDNNRYLLNNFNPTTSLIDEFDDIWHNV